MAVGIECCQWNPAIWGMESLRFLPTRWGNLSEEARGVFMPFAGRPFLCPAKQDFGLMMIGVLVAALADCITAEDWILENDGKEEDVYSGQPLMSGREDYHSFTSLALFCVLLRKTHGFPTKRTQGTQDSALWNGIFKIKNALGSDSHGLSLRRSFETLISRSAGF